MRVRVEPRGKKMQHRRWVFRVEINPEKPHLHRVTRLNGDWIETVQMWTDAAVGSEKWMQALLERLCWKEWAFKFDEIGDGYPYRYSVDNAYFGRLGEIVRDEYYGGSRRRCPTITWITADGEQFETRREACVHLLQQAKMA